MCIAGLWLCVLLRRVILDGSEVRRSWSRGGGGLLLLGRHAEPRVAGQGPLAVDAVQRPRGSLACQARICEAAGRSQASQILLSQPHTLTFTAGNAKAPGAYV